MSTKIIKVDRSYKIIRVHKSLKVIKVAGVILSINDAESFETISKNIRAYPATLNYTGDVLTSIVYTLEFGTITKTFNYSSGILTSIVLSGNTPNFIDLTKNIGYTGDKLTSITYT